MDADLSFNAYITVRPGKALTKTSTGCGYNEGSGHWWVEVLNFPTSWSIGDALQVDFTDTGAPGGVETGSVEVTLDGSGNQSAGELSLKPNSPVISTVSPPSGATTGGTSVTITGANFGSSRGSGSTMFGETEAMAYTIWVSDQLV